MLHAIRSDSGEHRSYRVDRMQDASVTSQSFSPRYLVELSAEGPLPVISTPARPDAIDWSCARRALHRGPGLLHHRAALAQPTSTDAQHAERRSTARPWTAR